MKFLAFDIETIPNQKIPTECIPQFNPDEVKLGNLKDPMKIRVRLAAEKDLFEKKLSKKMSVDPALAQVCTFVGMLCDTEKPYEDKIIKDCVLQLTDEDGHDDHALILGAWDFIARACNERIPLVSYNGISFDLPILFFRAICDDVPVDKFMYDRLTRKYRNMFHYDLMQILAGWDKSRWKKMEFYLNLFSIGSKGGMSGADVYPAYQAGEFDKIKEYCMNDVTSTCNLFERIRRWMVLTIEGASA